MVDEYMTGSIEVQKTTYGMENVAGISLVLKGTPTAKEYGEVNQEQITDANGKATFSYVPVGTYIISEKESSVPVGYYVAEPKSVTVYNAQTTNITFHNKSYGFIQIQKRTEGMTDLEGIKFTVSGTSLEGETVNKTATTDEKGLADFGELPIGTYVITEDENTVPYGYLYAEAKNATVSTAQTTNVEFVNEAYGELEIQKRTEGMTDLEGIKFILSGESNLGTEVNMEAVTDADGIAKFDKVPVGTYVITEDGESVPYGYFVADSVNATITKAQTTKIEVKNDSYGEVKIQKRTEGMVYVDGITFILEGTSDAGDAVRMTATTDKDGVAKFDKVPVGTYTVTEDGSTVPTGFLVAEPQKGTVLTAATTEMTFINDHKEDTPPKTGAENSAAALSISAIITVLSAVGIIFAKKRKA